MKKILFMLVALFSVAVFSNAQELRMRKYSFTENWSMSLLGGTNATFGDASKNVDTKKLFGPTIDLTLNKWFTPVFGTRLYGEWNQSHVVPTMEAVNTTTINNWGAGIDVMVNPLNFVSMNYDRKFNPVVLAGIGYLHTFDNGVLPIGDYVVPRIGLQLNLDVSNSVQLNLEGNAMLINDKFDGIVGNARYDGRVNLLAGVTYKFKNRDGSRGFHYVPSYDQSDIDCLNDKINEQRQVIDSLLTNPTRIVEQVIMRENIVTKEVAPITVTFALNSAKVDERQMANIDNVAIFMKDNSSVRLNLIGYADKETGTAEYNKELSQERAEAVASILVDKYDINKGRLVVSSEGDQVQQYEENDWNRAVIFMSIPENK